MSANNEVATVDSTTAPVQEPTGAPPADVYENEHEYLVIADLPGVKSDALTVHIDRQELLLEGKREASLRGGPSVYRRRFRIPEEIDISKADAKLNAGILTLHLPKREEVRPRRISISAG